MEEVMVVGRERLFGGSHFEGFRNHADKDHESLILKNFEFAPRSEVENDPSRKQPIAYSIILNPETKKVFVYRRPGKHTEQRLKSMWSVGLGGHINKHDLHGGNPVRMSMMRELAEEIGLEKPYKAKPLGYINYETDAVGQVHFGIVFIIETSETKLSPVSEEVQEGEFKTLEQISTLGLEEWTKICIEPLKQYLGL